MIFFPAIDLNGAVSGRPVNEDAVIAILDAVDGARTPEHPGSELA